MKKLLGIMLGILVTLTPMAITAGIKVPTDGASIETEHNVVYIMSGKTDTGAGSAFAVYPDGRTFHAKVVGTGAVTATVIIQVSNDGVTWINATASPHIALSGTTSASDGFAMTSKWGYVRAYVNAISGTSATVTVIMGV